VKKIKVLHISRGFEDYVISLVNQLARVVDLYLVLPEADRWVEAHVDSSINIVYSGAPKVSDPTNIVSFCRLLRLVSRINPDVIHFQSGVIWEGFLSILKPQYRYVTTVHDVVHHPHRGFLRFTPQFLLDAVARRSHAVIVHAEALKGLARSRYKHTDAEDSRIFMVKHPIISRYGTGTARSSAGVRILFFGTLDAWKGIETLLPAMEKITTALPDVKLVIAGRSAQPDYYRNLPYRFDNIVWDIRRQDEQDIVRLFSSADIVVLPYVEASQSGVLHLTQSFAVPVVATSVGGLAETISHGVNGLLVAPNDPAQLADAMYDLLTNEMLRRKIIGNMVAERDAQLLEGDVGAKTLQVYREAMKL
jgi:glycosyltransferase involved in cell wall biosynthesis